MTAIQIGKILVDRDISAVSVNGKPIRLTNSEFRVLERLDCRPYLIIALALSLGLWAAIWVVIAYSIRWALGW